MKVIIATSKAPHNHRTEFAMSTWLGADEVHEIECARTAADIGCTRGCYYVKDVFDETLKLDPDDIFVYINNDCALVPEWRDVLVPAVSKYGCAFSHRVQVSKFNQMFHADDLANVTQSSGADLVAFTPVWWKVQREIFPNVVFSHEAWDFAAKWLMRKSGFTFIPPIIWHESHVAFWNKPENLIRNPVQKVCRQRMIEWALANGAGERLSNGDYLFHGKDRVAHAQEPIFYSVRHKQQLKTWKYVGT